jgi:bifunctional N-acetylglucosamine-1-phosphate-uridyltransferase/glucosamine-1-phosphate-acetyltransferase GlmU-like protein
MKIGDQVYLISNRHQTGAGILCIISALHDSTVELVVEYADNSPILKVYSLEDILSSNVYTHSILNLVYQTYEEIQHKYGSILNLTSEEIVAQLVQNGLAPKTAHRCVDLIDHVAWQNQALPLRQWLESIRDVYHCPRRPVLKGFPSPMSRSAAPVAREAPPLASV